MAGQNKVPERTQARMKRCSKCKKYLSRTAFYKSSQAKDGLQSRCKECAKTEQRKYTRRKRWIQTYGKTPIQKAEWVNEQHIKRAGQLTTDITAEWLLTQWRLARLCPVCGHRYTKYGRHVRNLDHIIPLARGGVHMMSNVRIICRDCNLRKGDRVEANTVSANAESVSIPATPGKATPNDE